MSTAWIGPQTSWFPAQFKRFGGAFWLVLIALISSSNLASADAPTTGNVVLQQCSGSVTGRLCQDGTSCSNQSLNPLPASNSGQDNVTVQNVQVGDVITFSLSVPNIGPLSDNQNVTFNQSNPTQGSFGTIAGDGLPLVGNSTSFSISVPGSAIATYTVQAGDLGNNDSNYTTKIQIQSTGQQKYALLDYTLSCTRPPTTSNLTIAKVSLAGTGSFQFTKPGENTTFQLTTQVPNTPVTQVFNNLSATAQGTNYTVNETIPSGWKLTDVTCTAGATPTANLQTGQTTIKLVAGTNPTCTFTNTKDGATTANLTIAKTTVGGTGTFSFTTPGANTTFQLATQSPNTPVSTTFADLAATAQGTDYTVNETIPSGWKLTDVTCTAGATPTANLQTGQTTIKVVSGTTPTCTFTNTKDGTTTANLTIAKLSVGGAGTFSFTTPGANTTFQLTTQSPNTPVSTTFTGLAATAQGTDYTVNETIPSGWKLSNVACTAGATPTANLQTGQTTIKVVSGTTPTCTYTNTKDDKLTASLTIQKTPTPTTYSAAGQAIAYAYIVTNTGNATVTTISVADNRIAGVTCLATTLAAGASTTCSGTYLTTLADVSNKSVVNVASATGTGPANAVVKSNNATATITFKAGQDDAAKQVTDLFVKRRIDNLLTNGPDRARIIARLNDPEEQPQSLKDGPLKLADGGSDARSGASGGAPSRFGFGPSGGGLRSLDRMGFADNLGRNLKEDEPTDEQRLRYDGSPYHAGMASERGGTLPSMLGTTVGLNGDLRFATSLSELRAMSQASEERKLQQKLNEAGLGLTVEPSQRLSAGLRTGWDFWVEGQFSRYNDSTGGIDRDGQFGVVYVGADYAVSKRVLLGALVQFDWTSEDINDTSQTGNMSGRGWLAGPYLGIKLDQNLYFDARAAWGTSRNNLMLNDNSLGTRYGEFDTTRWLTTATLTGDFHRGPWRFTPQVGLAYGQESYDDYVTSLGGLVPGANFGIGRVTANLEVGYAFRHANGTIVEPQVGIGGIWNFDSDDVLVGGVLVDSSATRGKAEAGVLVRMPNGSSMRAAMAYDGIGTSDFSAVTGKAYLNFPLN